MQQEGEHGGEGGDDAGDVVVGALDVTCLAQIFFLSFPEL